MINPFDAVIFLILLLSGLFAMMRGFTREVLSIFAWAGGVIAATALFPYARPFGQALITPDWLADTISGVTIFLVAVVLLTFLNHAISQRVKGSPVGALDHTLGFIFGAGRGALLAVIIFLGIGWVFPERPLWLIEARTLPLLEAGTEALLRLNPNREVETPEIPGFTNPLKEEPKAENEATDSPDQTGYKMGQRRALEQLLDSSDAKH